MLIQADIGRADEKGADTFNFQACTPAAIVARVERDSRAYWSRSTLVMPVFSWDEIERALNQLVRGFEAPTWEQTAEKLNRYKRCFSSKRYFLPHPSGNPRARVQRGSTGGAGVTMPSPFGSLGIVCDTTSGRLHAFRLGVVIVPLTTTAALVDPSQKMPWRSRGTQLTVLDPAGLT